MTKFSGPRAVGETLDRADLRILAALQRNADMSIAQLSDEVGLSANPCWKRLKRLERDGYIRRRVAVLDRVLLGLPITVFVSIRTGRHQRDWLSSFATAVSAMPQVTEIYRMSGDVDYLLKVVVPDVATYDRFYKELIGIADLTDVSSSFAMEEIKQTTELPLEARR